jgi:galactose mutarotase-like enzyme
MEYKMAIKLENNMLEVLIKEKGAELCGMKLKTNNVQYIWQADSKYWGRHSPLLFPIVGKLKDDSYVYEGKTYTLAQHGFARDFTFDIVEQKPEHVVMQLKSNADTRNQYPWDFILTVKFQLSFNLLHVFYSVKNTDKKEMLFSIGAHPGFNCPLLPNEKMEDYYLEFDTPQTLRYNYLVDGLVSNQKKLLMENTNKLNLSKDLFKTNAIVLEGLKSRSVSIKSNLHDMSITMDFTGFPYLGIWSLPKGAPFICIEPWFGLSDSESANGNIIYKKGIVRLSPKAEFECSHSIKVN